MRIVVAQCKVKYSGRGETQLPEAIRAIIIKADGAVSIHADTNGNKPLNYMGAGNKHHIKKRKRTEHWVFTKKNETIDVTISKILHDISFSMSESEPGLSRKGTEKHLHHQLIQNPASLGLPHQTPMHMEYLTGAGQVDLLAEISNIKWLAIEVKRHAQLPAIDQIRRYVDALKSRDPEKEIIGAIAAYTFSESVIKQADKYGIQLIEIKPL